MRVFLTGGTGNVGAGVLDALLAAGHDVTGAVRSDASAQRLVDAGATPVRVDLAEAGAVAAAVGESDAVVHTAAPGDASGDAVDDAVITGVERAFRDTGRVFVFTGGVWALGSGRDLSGSSPFDPIPLVASRPPKIERVLALGDAGMRTAVVSPPDLYAVPNGLFPMLADAPVQDGRLLFPGSGDQLVGSVHRDDIATLYVAAVEQDEAQGHVVGASAESVPMREIVAAFAEAKGLDGVAPEPEAASRERLGPLYDAWLLDQTYDLSDARRLGWEPVQPSLLETLRG